MLEGIIRGLSLGGTIVYDYMCVSGIVARSAGPYDGKWSGQGPEKGDCGVLTVTLVISDNKITGTVTGKHGSPISIRGQLVPMERQKFITRLRRDFRAASLSLETGSLGNSQRSAAYAK